MTRNRLFLAALFTAAAATLYAVLGFFALPYLAKNWIVAHVEQRLNHRLTLGEVRFNPFTGVVGIADADLRDASGTALLAWRHLLVDFSLRGLWRRTWTFDAVRIDAPLLRGELRADGTHNFTGLVEALHDLRSKPQAPPRIAIGRIEIEDGRIELANLAQGEKARLTLAPVRFALTDFHTEHANPAGYTLSARTHAGERIELTGNITAAPPAVRGRLALHGLQLATLAGWLGRAAGVEDAGGSLELSATYDVRAGANPVFGISDLTLTGSNLAFATSGSSEPFAALKALQLDGGAVDLIERTVSAERLELAGVWIALARDADGKPNWPVKPDAAPSQAGAGSSASQATSTAGWRVNVQRAVVADSTLRYADTRSDSPTQLAFTDARLELSVALRSAAVGRNRRGAGACERCADRPGLTAAAGTVRPARAWRHVQRDRLDAIAAVFLGAGG